MSSMRKPVAVAHKDHRKFPPAAYEYRDDVTPEAVAKIRAKAAASVKKAKLALTEVVGVEPTTEISMPPQPASLIAETLEQQVETLIQAAWKTRPDLLAKAQDLQRAHKAAQIAHSAYLPTARLAAQGGRSIFGCLPAIRRASLSATART